MGRMHAPGKGISSSAIVSNYLVVFSIEFYGVFLAIQKICPIMAKAICRRDQGRHLQARQEGLQAITHWCPS